jgi:hypothetical protein
MPGLHLTVPQAARLFGLNQGACRDVIDSLVGMSFLRWTTAGAITRAQGMDSIDICVGCPPPSDNHGAPRCSPHVDVLSHDVSTRATATTTRGNYTNSNRDGRIRGFEGFEGFPGFWFQAFRGSGSRRSGVLVLRVPEVRVPEVRVQVPISNHTNPNL